MNSVTVLYFMTTGWTCPACIGMKPHVIQVCNDSGVQLFMVDISKTTVDENGLIGEDEGVRYNICGLPTVVVLKSGQEVGRIDNGVTKQGVIDLISAAKRDD